MPGHGRWLLRHGSAATLVASLVMLVAASPAPARTIGSVMPIGSSTGGCPANDGFVQTSVAPSTASYTVAADGILTSWSTRAGGGANQLLKLKLLRPPQSGTTYAVVGESAFETLAPDQVNTLPARIPVHAGDVIALKVGSTDNVVDCVYATTSSADAYRDDAEGPDSPPNGSMDFANGPTAGRVNLAATVESDAVGDGFGDETQDLCWTDPSTQGTCPAPTIDASPQVGKTLTATPQGAPMNPSYAWLRCDAAGGACAPVPGANATTYRVSADDEGHTLRLRQSATNAGGSQVSDSAPTAFLPFPARIFDVGLTRTRFRVSVTPKLVQMSRAPAGTTITYALDEAAAVRLAFTQPAPGRRVNGRCVGQTRRNRHRRRCTLLVTRGSLTVAGHAGQNAIRFFGWVSSFRRLAPGRYTLVITAITAGVGSTAQTRKLTIVR